MKGPYMLMACFAVAILGIAITLGFYESRVERRAPTVTENQQALTQRQILERRRGRMAEVAIAATTQ